MPLGGPWGASVPTRCWVRPFSLLPSRGHRFPSVCAKKPVGPLELLAPPGRRFLRRSPAWRLTPPTWRAGRSPLSPHPALCPQTTPPALFQSTVLFHQNVSARTASGRRPVVTSVVVRTGVPAAVPGARGLQQTFSGRVTLVPGSGAGSNEGAQGRVEEERGDQMLAPTALGARLPAARVQVPFSICFRKTGPRGRCPGRDIQHHCRKESVPASGGGGSGRLTAGDSPGLGAGRRAGPAAVTEGELFLPCCWKDDFLSEDVLK